MKTRDVLDYIAGGLGAVGGIFSFIGRSYVSDIKKNVDENYTKKAE